MLRCFLLTFSTFLYGLYALGQPLNDNCNAAERLVFSLNGEACTTGSLTGATDDGYYSVCEQAGSREVWFVYSVIGTQNIIRVFPMGNNPATNLVVNISSDTCGGTLLYLCDGANNLDTAGVARTYPLGSTILISISSNAGNNGDFGLCVTSFDTATSVGKSCDSAIDLCSLSPFTTAVYPGSTANTPPCFTSPMQKPIAYKFTVSKTGLLNWLATPQCVPSDSGGEFDWSFYDISNGCPGTVIACNYNYTGGFSGNSTAAPQGMQGGPGLGCSNTSATGMVAGEICPGVIVDSGKTYLIMIDQYTLNMPCSVHFDFSGSTCMAGSGLAVAFDAVQNGGCMDSVIRITNGTAGGANYLWNFGQGASDTSNLYNPGLITYHPGIYQITLTVSKDSCTSSSSKWVNTNAAIPLSVVASSDSFCAGTPVTLSAYSPLPGGSYSWATVTGNSSSIIATPFSNTTYTVSYSYNGCTSSDSVDVTVYPPSIPFVIQHGDTLFTDTFSSYQWYFSGAPIAGETSNYIVITQAGIFSVAVTDSLGCGGSSSNFTAQLSGLAHMVGLGGATVFPNPANGIFTLHFLSSSIYDVKVIDTEGRVITTKSFLADSASFDLIDQPSGVYFVTISSATYNGIFKIALMKH